MSILYCAMFHQFWMSLNQQKPKVNVPSRISLKVLSNPDWTYGGSSFGIVLWWCSFFFPFFKHSAKLCSGLKGCRTNQFSHRWFILLLSFHIYWHSSSKWVNVFYFCTNCCRTNPSAIHTLYLNYILLAVFLLANSLHCLTINNH